MTARSLSEIYLDANATTPVLPLAAKEAFDAMEELYGNPSSSHITGLRARSILESARHVARSVLGAEGGRIIFTSGATEAIQMAIFSTLCTVRDIQKNNGKESGGRFLLYGATEHKAVPQALHHWNRLLGLAHEVLPIPVNRKGMLDLDFLRDHASRADMVCTMSVNNETGAIHDLERIESVLREHNATVPWMVDCVQAIAKMQLNLARTTIDYAPISGHKVYAPKGIGLLYVRQGMPLVPLLAGGGQEGGARGGTENLPGVAAIAAVLRCLQNPNASRFHSPQALAGYRDRLVDSLRSAFPSIVFNTAFECAVPTTINFSVKGFASKEILDLFDAAGLRVSSGSACGSALQGSYVLEAMGYPQWRSEGAIRLSFGPATPTGDIEAACLRIEEAGRALNESCLIVSHDLDDTPGIVLDGLVQLKKGSMCTWVWLDARSNRCLIIDPFEDLAERIESLIRCQNSRVIAILDTHRHVDHESCRELLLKVLASYLDESAVTQDDLGWPDQSDGTVQLGDQSSAPCMQLSCDLVLAKTPLPGHTIDGFALLLGKPRGGRLDPTDVRYAFTGDTILIGGIGRTDFYSSSAEDLYNSLRRLPQLIAPMSLVCPTHDYNNGFTTCLQAEHKGNEFLARILDPVAALSLSQFQNEKTRIDECIDDESNSELVCGLIQPFEVAGSSIDIRADELPEFFRQHQDSLVIDVREAHEFHFAQDWSTLGFVEPPENIPLTRFTNFLPKLMEPSFRKAGQDVIFVCRSGNRSGKAAEVVRRLGIPNAWHIAGGIALGVPHGSPQQHDELEMEFVI